MRKVVYAMGVSLDGFIEDVAGAIDWTEPSPELHQHFNDLTSEFDTDLYGRRMYENMAAAWPTADADAAATPEVVEYAGIWRQMKKVVFSTTLQEVGWNARLVRGDLAGEIARLKSEPGKNMGLGGAGIAESFMRLGLIDEYRLYIHPVVLGGGKRMFPALDARIGLRLAGTQTFPCGVVQLRYERDEA